MDEYLPALTQVAFLLADFDALAAWLVYLGYGGNRDRRAVDAYLNGLKPLPARDSDLLAFVINERLTELHIPDLASYRD